jgi:hypothetical protein
MAAEFLKRVVDISFPVLRGIEKRGATAVVPVRFCTWLRFSRGVAFPTRLVNFDGADFRIIHRTPGELNCYELICHRDRESFVDRSQWGTSRSNNVKVA